MIKMSPGGLGRTGAAGPAGTDRTPDAADSARRPAYGPPLINVDDRAEPRLDGYHSRGFRARIRTRSLSTRAWVAATAIRLKTAIASPMRHAFR